jgi:ionotropic glutamate receptor NMDA 3A
MVLQVDSNSVLLSTVFCSDVLGNFSHILNMSFLKLLSQRVGAPRASAADYYVHRANQHLWEHMQKYSVIDVEDGIHHLK